MYTNKILINIRAKVHMWIHLFV